MDKMWYQNVKLIRFQSDMHLENVWNYKKCLNSWMHSATAPHHKLMIWVERGIQGGSKRMSPPVLKMCNMQVSLIFLHLLRKQPKLKGKTKIFLTTWKQLHGKYVHFGQKDPYIYMFHLWIWQFKKLVNKGYRNS